METDIDCWNVVQGFCFDVLKIKYLVCMLKLYCIRNTTNLLNPKFPKIAYAFSLEILKINEYW